MCVSVCEYQPRLITLCYDIRRVSCWAGNEKVGQVFNVYSNHSINDTLDVGDFYIHWSATFTTIFAINEDLPPNVFQ